MYDLNWPLPQRSNQWVSTYTLWLPFIAMQLYSSYKIKPTITEKRFFSPSVNPTQTGASHEDCGPFLNKLIKQNKNWLIDEKDNSKITKQDNFISSVPEDVPWPYPAADPSRNSKTSTAATPAACPPASAAPGSSYRHPVRTARLDRSPCRTSARWCFVRRWRMWLRMKGRLVYEHRAS